MNIRILLRPVCWIKGHKWGGWHPFHQTWHLDPYAWRECQRCGVVEYELIAHSDSPPALSRQTE